MNIEDVKRASRRGVWEAISSEAKGYKEMFEQLVKQVQQLKAENVKLKKELANCDE